MCNDNEIERISKSWFLGFLCHHAREVRTCVIRENREVMDVKQYDKSWKIGKIKLSHSTYEINYGKDFLKEEKNPKMGFINKPK